MQLPLIDLIVFLVYMTGVVLFGCSFFFRSKGEDSAGLFTSGAGRLPAWAVGMSIFATYISSISFLALPGKAFGSNWNAFVFSLSIPIAAIVAVKFFIPLYRSLDSVSAYSYLEDRFGPWARIYASLCYLVSQIARIGAVTYLLALPMNALLGWSIPSIILVTGVAVMLYSMMGGIRAVIWTDAIQGIVLIGGVLLCLTLLLIKMPGGVPEAVRVASAEGKFSLGSFSISDWSTQTFWVCLFYGLFINLNNFGIDQNYIQRYMSARNMKDAIRSTLFGSCLYVPVSLLFFCIGTALFCYYKASPGLLPAELAATPDKVFPYFIVNGLPSGVTGLLIAAVFAAGMSTISTSLNSGATIMMTDYYKRYFNKGADDRAEIIFLRFATVVLGVAGVGCALAMIKVKSALDAWWAMQSIFSGGMLGLFLLGYFCKKARNAEAAIGVLLGLLVIAWITLLQVHFESVPKLHANLSIVLGTMVIFFTGFLLTIIFRGGAKGKDLK
jgi:SSS family solute:Na+ symporter